MKKERLIKYAMMSAIYITTTVMALHHEVQANEQPVETHPATVLPENLPQRYKELRFLNFQPVETQPETTTPSRLASVANLEPLTQPVEAVLPTLKRFAPEDTLSAISGLSSTVQCIVGYEVGGVGFDPYAVGQEGELGIAQLHPDGLLKDFFKRGNTDPNDPYQAALYIEELVAEGRGNNWTSYRLGWCS